VLQSLRLSNFDNCVFHKIEGLGFGVGGLFFLQCNSIHLHAPTLQWASWVEDHRPRDEHLQLFPLIGRRLASRHSLRHTHTNARTFSIPVFRVEGCLVDNQGQRNMLQSKVRLGRRSSDDCGSKKIAGKTNP
ncbi:hypothetical protein IRJ41_019026, partial [Triplophysa rosa]